MGTNRQSYLSNLLNCGLRSDGGSSYEIGSCFPAFDAVSQYLESIFDTFMMADLYGDLPDGSSYELATRDNAAELEHSHWVFDESKVSILIAQMQKVAIENPDAEIIFTFFDDRPDILKGIRTFFDSKCPQFRPPNVVLQLRQYAGGRIIYFADIDGIERGSIDYQYRETIKKMAKIVPFDKRTSSCNFAKDLTAEKVKSLSAVSEQTAESNDYEPRQTLSSNL